MKKVKRITEISDERYHYSSGYYVENKWIDRENVILLRSEAKEISRQASGGVEVQLVKCNVYSGEIEVLCSDVNSWIDYLVKGETVFYIADDTLKALNVKTGENRIVCRREGIAFPHSTTAGKVLSLTDRKQSPVIFITVNTQTGEVKELLQRGFQPPFDKADHGMICPTDPDLLFYCHEGNTRYITNRLWLYDDRTKKTWNIAKQRLNEDGELADCYGHEMWAPDGKGLYFVKYIASPEKPCGICYVDIQTGKTKLLYSGFSYWHVGVSADGRFLLADTQTGTDYSKVVLIDQEKGTELLIDRAVTNWKHPCHPHPQLSPDNGKVIYNALNKHGKTSVKIAFLEDIYD